MLKNICLFTLLIFEIVILSGCSKDDNKKNPDKILKIQQKNRNTKFADPFSPTEKNKLSDAGADKSSRHSDLANTSHENKIVKPALNKKGKLSDSSIKVPSNPKTLKGLFYSLKIPEIVATIGNQKITREDLYDEIESKLPKMFREAPLNPQLFEMISSDINLAVETLINQEILLRLAAKDGLEPSSDMIKKDFDKSLEEFSPKELEEIKTQLKATGSSLQKRREEVSSDLKVQKAFVIKKWIDDKVMAKIKVDDEVVKAFYHKNKEQFKKPAAITVAHILIMPEKFSSQLADKINEDKKNFDEKADIKAKKECQLLFEKLKEGQDFSKLAKEKSASSTQVEEGVLPQFDRMGRCSRGVIDPVLTEASFKLKPGEISKPVKTRAGYHIIKCLDLKEAYYMPFEKIKNDLKITLKNKKIGEFIKTLIDAEKDKQKVVIYLKEKKENVEK